MANIIRSASRRDVLKIGGLAAAGSMLGAGQGRAAHEPQLHARKFVHPGLRRLLQEDAGSGIRKRRPASAVDYQLISVGSLQTRIATAAETGNGPDITLACISTGHSCSTTSWSMSATSPRRSARRTAVGTTLAKEAVIVNGKWKAIPFGNVGQLMNWRTDWFARGRHQGLSRHLGRTAGSRHQVEEGRTIHSASNSDMASATTTAGCIRCCGRTARARSSRTARPS